MLALTAHAMRVDASIDCSGSGPLQSMLASTRIVAHTGLPTYAARTSASVECSGSGPLQSTLAMVRAVLGCVV